SAESEQRASTPRAEVRILSEACTGHRGRAARRAPAKRARAVRARPGSPGRTKDEGRASGPQSFLEAAISSASAAAARFARPAPYVAITLAPPSVSPGSPPPT